MVHKELSLVMFWVFRASELEHSNLKGKGGKSLSIRNKTFPFGNS